MPIDNQTAPKAQHTPGPWRINPAPNAKHEIVADGECMVICRTTEKLYMKSATANAHLIAAAPELLESLRALSLMYEACYYEASAAADDPTLIKARAAIAKAEGR